MFTNKSPNSKDKENAEKFYKMGQDFWDNGKVQDAIECFKKALIYNPKHQASLTDLKLLEEDEKYKEKKRKERLFTTHSPSSISKNSKYSYDTKRPKQSLFQGENEKPGPMDNNNSADFNFEPNLENSVEKPEKQEGTSLDFTLQEAILKIQKDFTPEVTCSNIQGSFNFDLIPIKEYQNSPPKALNRDKKGLPNSPKVKWSKPARSQIGEWGETFIYYKLKSLYEKSYHIKETHSGFEGTFQDKPNRSLTLIWHLKNGEPEHCVDFTLIEKEQEQEKRREYIEVKSTPNNKPSNAKFSENEINAMRNYDGQYKILRLYNVGKGFNENNNVQIKEIKNPREKLFGLSAAPNLGITSFKLNI